jgi:cyanophycin synthetase
VEIIRTRIFEAGNVYARRPVIEMTLAATPMPELTAEEVAGLLASLPPLRDEVTDFAGYRRLTDKASVPASAVVEVLAVILQRYMNWPLRFSSWWPDRDGDAAQAVFEIGTRRAGLRAGRLAVQLLAAFLEDREADLQALFGDIIRSLVRSTGRETPPLDALNVARAASRRGIAWTPLPDSFYLRLGTGRHAHVLLGSETTTTSSIGRDLARRKSVTNTILSAAGLPVARQKVARRLQDAQAAAAEIGYPVVVKPSDGNMGKGVTIGITDADGLARAFGRAQIVSRDVVIEEVIAGEEHRLLVIDGRFVAAAGRRPAQVVGDGVSSVHDLVARENARPIRETLLPGRMAARLPIHLDEEAIRILAEQNRDEDSLPEKGEIVFLRRESNVSRGGDSTDQTDRVHPSVREVAERAAKVLGIDVCGVDFLSTDISRPWQETGGAICEVNTRPGLILHKVVSEGQGKDVSDDLLHMLYPKGARSSIPVVAILECAEAGALRSAIEVAAARAGRRLGAKIPASAKKAARKETRRLESVSALQWDESIDAAVVEVSARDVARRGLGLERVDLAILPPSVEDETTRRACAALSRAAGNRVVTIEDPDAMASALRVVGLRARRKSPPAVMAEAKKAAPTRKPTGDFTAMLVGDIGFGESYMHHPRAGSLQQLLGTHGHIYSLQKLRGLLGSADMVVGNLEAPLSAIPDAALRGRKKYLCWSDAEQSVAALKEAGIHAVTLANNHALDGGAVGLMETLASLRAAKIPSFGAGPDAERAGRPLVKKFEIGGIEHSLVFFGAFEHRQRYENRYRWYARRDTAGVNELSAERIGATIENLRDRLPRPIFVAYPHWGVDYTDVNDAQRETAEALVAAGVNLIIGHGSHTAQAIEMIGRTPVVYGLGNFVWNTPGRFTKMEAKPYGLAAALRFRQGASGPEATLRLYPILTDNNLTSFQNRLLDEAEFAEVAPELTRTWHQTPRLGADAVASHFEIDVPLRPTGRPLDERQKLFKPNGALPSDLGHGKAMAIN